MIRFLAAGMAVCLQAGLSCPPIVDLPSNDEFNFVMKFEPIALARSIIWTPGTGENAFRFAMKNCRQRLVVNNDGMDIVNDPESSVELLPFYEYLMFDGQWGTEFVCRDKGVPMS